MKMKIEGTWKNSDGSIIIKINYIPEKSDEYSLEYSANHLVQNDFVHISYSNNNVWHIIDNVSLGSGFLIFLSEKEILIKTSKFDELKLERTDLSC